MKTICSKSGLDWEVSECVIKRKTKYICPHCCSKQRRKKAVIFVAGFVISCLLIPCAADYADRNRGYDATGGEIFLPLLYLSAVAVIKSVSDIKKENAQQ